MDFTPYAIIQNPDGSQNYVGGSIPLTWETSATPDIPPVELPGGIDLSGIPFKQIAIIGGIALGALLALRFAK